MLGTYCYVPQPVTDCNFNSLINPLRFKIRFIYNLTQIKFQVSVRIIFKITSKTNIDLVKNGLSVNFTSCT